MQITASEEVIEARMVAFMSRKRSENDASNVQEYCKRMNSDQVQDLSLFHSKVDKIMQRVKSPDEPWHLDMCKDRFGNVQSFV